MLVINTQKKRRKKQIYEAVYSANSTELVLGLTEDIKDLAWSIED